MKYQEVSEIIECMPKGRTLFPYCRDRYAALLLQWLTEDATTISAAKNSPHAQLLNKPILQTVLAQAGHGKIHHQQLAWAWQEPLDSFLLTLGIWGGNRRQYQQTTRNGYNLVLHFNINEGYRRQFDSCIPSDKAWWFDSYGHPVLTRNCPLYRQTLGWIRMDIDLDSGEALIEEIQNDWLRDVQSFMKRCGNNKWEMSANQRQRAMEGCQYVLQRFGKIWDEALLAAALWFLHIELGINRIWYHSFASGNKLKNISYASKPPRSLYTRLPKRFCFQHSEQAAQFLQNDKGYRRTIKKAGPIHWHYLQLCQQ